MKKIKFLGMTFDVVEESDMVARAAGQQPEDRDMYIVTRVADMDARDGSQALRARRLTVPCEDCDALCWLDPASRAQLAAVQVVVVCVQCSTRRIRAQRADRGAV